MVSGSAAPAGADIIVPSGFIARAATMADIPAVTELVAAAELADEGVVEIDEEDLSSEWERPSVDPEADARLVLAGDRLVGVAEVTGNAIKTVWAWVHPEYRGLGIGTALVDWTERQAAAGGGKRVGQTLSENERVGRVLLGARGYTPLWTSWILQIEFDGPPEPPSPPEGIAIRGFQSGQDDHAVYRVIEDAFGVWQDREPVTFEDWRALTIGRPSFRPWHFQLAVEGDQVVGAAMLLEYEGDEGWVQQLAVRESHRNRGIARALLQQCFGWVYREQGRTKCGLSTDSRTGALSLYEKVGMHVRRTYTRLSKDL